jgi:hypothetical protein
MGNKRDNAIIEFLKTPITVGEIVSVRGLGLQNKTLMGNHTEIIEICKTGDVNDIIVKEYGNLIKVKVDDYQRSTKHIGENVISHPKSRINILNYDIESIAYRLKLRDNYVKYETISGIKVAEVNWNPYVINKEGVKEYFQRGFVWNLEQNQNLIESIYSNIDCGKILVRHRKWTELEGMIKIGLTEELSFYDIIDGKQRLNAIRGFLDDEYPDHLGNYFSDLSINSQHAFNMSMLFSYSEIDGDVSDSYIISQFLKLNFMGVPQSKEHLDFVREINNKL